MAGKNFVNYSYDNEQAELQLQQTAHWAMEGHMKYPQTVNAWAGIVGNNIVQPFLIDGYVCYVRAYHR